ncbi:protein HOMOLOG OF MAMMALIAN LYST-INTERACTING PROTEIN 5 [Mercurialis annua]|uniref:protein HOMOLOG OF MAMMALIAN LYST-INTERACTING PROTEIN 5 n=1 Tax=Mercurialis annua TaxID=3986 RepID=UPI00215EA565|nr:protein HOMOLOG OF MAMMALIAN LYST-INTERACTING PROTEIN 5 [Mercurialis annua]
MAGDNEPAKLLLPYLQRADELQKHEHLVAYYCRLYAMEKGLRIPQSERTKTTNALLISLMNQLEKDKKSLNLGPENNLHVEGFALNVFGKADKQDRAGRADLNTAKTFYAASIFFEILNQFGPLLPDLEQKQKYAVWKAADIRKALKEGRKPNPGPPSGDDDLSIPSSTSGGGYDVGTTETRATSHRPESDNQSPHFNDQVDRHSTGTPPSAMFHERTNNHNSAHMGSQPSFHDPVNNHHSASIPPTPPAYPSGGYSSHDFHPPPPSSSSEESPYSQPYHQPYTQEPPQQHVPHNYPSNEMPSSYSLPNFQSYPGFTESSLPSVPTHYPSYYQGSESPHAPQSAPPSNYPSTAQYSSSSRNGTNLDPAPPATQAYQYDSNYQPPPEKIAEAHKAARFAVGALAFDDVSIAVEHLKKSLELLTNPSSSQ